jgi:beta-glucanase (GH16 family)
MKKHYLFLIFYVLYTVVGYSQVPPIKDKNWVLNKPLSDEFNGTSVDTAKWHLTAFAWYSIAYPQNVTIEDITRNNNNGNEIGVQPNRMLRLKAISRLSTGGIETKEHNYLYGYYEIRARLPGYFNAELNQHCSRGLWPTLYTSYQVRDPNNFNCILEHNEIDIVEPSGNTHGNNEWTDDAQTNSIGHHLHDPPCNAKKYGAKYVHNLPPMYENFHKYAAECLPDRIIYYFDDVPIHTVYGMPFPNTLMRVTICSQMNHKDIFEGYNTPWPLYYDVDYFRYYQLNTQYCNTDALIANNTQLSSFIYGVRRNITIGNGTAAISLSVGESVTFRATNNVTINGDFTVPLGCELNIIPTPCP